MSIDDYARRIEEAGNLRVEFKTEAQAKKALREIRKRERVFRKLKREINADVREIRATYRKQIAAAGEGGEAASSLPDEGRAGGRLTAAAKREKRAERDQVLAPYDSLKRSIDDFLKQTADIKGQLQDFIGEMKDAGAEEECPFCGVRNPVEAVQCWSCGGALDW
jgi:hypothetical protein